MKQWLPSLFEESPGVASVRRVVFFLAFLFGTGLCLLRLRLEVSGPLKDMAIAIVTGAFGVMGTGCLAEAWESRNDERG
jgi:hypothetical protein